jgi:hypothetical protein
MGAWADPVSWGDPGSAGTFPLAPRTRRLRKQTRADEEELHPRVVYCAGSARKYDVLLMRVIQLDTICICRCEYASGKVTAGRNVYSNTGV